MLGFGHRHEWETTVRNDGALNAEVFTSTCRCGAAEDLVVPYKRVNLDLVDVPPEVALTLGLDPRPVSMTEAASTFAGPSLIGPPAYRLRR